MQQRRLAAGVCLVCVALAGCSSADARPASTPAPRPSSSPAQVSPTWTPTMARPDPPEAVTRGDLAGQEAFIEYWFDTFDYAIATGDTGPMMAVAEDGCVDCEDMRREVDAIYSAGGHVEGALHTVTEKVAVPHDEDGLALPTVTFTQAAGTDVYPDGRRTPSPSSSKMFNMAVVFDGTAWSFYGFGRIE